MLGVAGFRRDGLRAGYGVMHYVEAERRALRRGYLQCAARTTVARLDGGTVCDCDVRGGVSTSVCVVNCLLTTGQ